MLHLFILQIQMYLHVQKRLNMNDYIERKPHAGLNLRYKLFNANIIDTPNTLVINSYNEKKEKTTTKSRREE